MTDTTAPRPRLGEFSKPTNPRVRGTAEDNATSPVPPAETRDSDEEILAQIDSKDTDGEVEAKERMSLYEEMNQALLPVQDYRKFLKEHKISEDDAEDIVDALLTRGYYEEVTPITRRRNVTLRTREHRDLLRLQVVFQVKQPVYQGAVDELTVRYNLAASLVSFDDKAFEFPTHDTSDTAADKMFDVRMEYIERMPSPLFTKLSMKLAAFDRKIAAVMREGVSENF